MMSASQSAAKLLFFALCWIAAPLLPAQANSTVLKLTLHDTIQPISAEYLQRGLQLAAQRHAQAVLLSLGTPGGLLDSTRMMVQAIESSPTPVIVYISPSGSRAGSAGFFLLESADVAAMAPGTNAGAAHPVLEGAGHGEQMDPILKQKIENDAAAFLRSFVERRGRNTAAAEDAVRNSKSYSDQEALQLRLIDLIAPDDATLLHDLDGRQIRRFDGTSVTLHLQNAAIQTLPPSLRERLLSRLTDPNIAVLLLFAGALLIYLEFNVPGTIVPGALGTLLVLLAGFGLNLLPLHHTAILLLLGAVVLIGLEMKFPSHGILSLAGIACLVFGLATLVDGPIPELRVHLSIAIAAGLSFGLITVVLASLALRAKRNKVLLGPQALIGRQAVARTDLDPTGQVEVRGELWQAAATNNVSVPAGTLLIVQSVHDLTLLVQPQPGSPAAHTGPATR